MNFLGEKLKRLRELKRWSLADMAKVTGISTTSHRKKTASSRKDKAVINPHFN